MSKGLFNQHKKSSHRRLSLIESGSSCHTTISDEGSSKVEDDTLESITSGPSSVSNEVLQVPLRQQSLLGLSMLSEQVHRKLRDNKFNFTLMVVGTSGLGKSTFINSIFRTEIYSNQYPGPSQRSSLAYGFNNVLEGSTTHIASTSVLLEENLVQTNLTVVDTPGFGDELDNTDCWKPIVDYIDRYHHEYLIEESATRQREIVDKRVHCCIYFIEPTGHRLKRIDIETMKMLHHKVNIIPVIAKADTLIPEELASFKRRVSNKTLI